MRNLQESFYKILMNSISDMVFVMKVVGDGEFIYVYLNRAALERTTYKESIIGKSIQEVNPPETAAFLCERYQKVVCEQMITTYEDSFISKKGERVYSRSTLSPLIDEQNTCSYVIATVHDITKRVEIARQLAESEQHFRIIAENAGDLITLIDHKGKIIYVSPSHKDVLGIDAEEFEGKSFLYNVHPDDQVVVKEKLMQAMIDQEPQKIEFIQFTNEHEQVWSESNVTPVFDEDNHFNHMVIVTRDVSKQKDYEAKLEYFAHHDTLTGLPNRRLVVKYLTDAIKNLQENEEKFAVMIIDIDDFKNINDEMGHDFGDQVIEKYGKRLSKSVGENDIVARLGGDEFIIILPDITTVDRAILIVENIQESIRKPWNIKDHIFHMTSSIGIAIVSSPHDTTTDSILKQADIALYEAKGIGGNTYKIKQ